MNRIFILIVFCFGAFITEAQNNNPDIQLQANWNGQSMELHWTPTSQEIWQKGWQNGYRIGRSLSILKPDEAKFKETGQLVLDTIPFADASYDFFPKAGIEVQKGDSTWAENNRALGDGFGEEIANILFPSNSTDNNAGQKQFQYAQFASQYFPNFDFGLAQGFLDTTLDTLKNNNFVLCNYTVTLIDDPTVFAKISAVPSISSPTQYNVSPFVYQTDLVTFERVKEAPKQIDRMGSMSKAYGDSIVLRWVPYEGYTYVKSIEDGFQIVKYEIPEIDPAVIAADPNFDYSVLKGTPIDTNYVSKWDSAQFTAYKDKDSMILVTAMVVYGDFKKGTNNQKEYADALKNKYGYGMYAAEMSKNAANSLGLRWVDYNVEPGKKYRYEVSFKNKLASPVKSRTEIKNVYESVPIPFDFKTIAGEYLIGLSLDKEKNEENFSMYFFERSDDMGSSWRALNTKPISFTFDDDTEELATILTISDSVPELYKKYQYRVRALNSFHEYSDWATVEGISVDLTPTDPPTIYEPEQIGANMVSISWEPVSELSNPDLLGYKVKVGDSDPATAKPISGLITKDKNAFIYTGDFTPENSYFFSVVAVDTAGNEASSVPIMLSIIDSIPPVAPSGLIGKIDTNGFVNIFWPHNKEEDLFGYRVYFANDSTAEFTQMTKTDIQYNYFNDTLALTSLSEEIYYKVQAVDSRYNRSELSKTLVVKRPDLVPPAAPILLQPTPDKTGIKLAWRQSNSTDVLNYFLLRRENNALDTTWVLIDSISADSSGYVDASTTYEVNYEYTIYAKDDAGWLSSKSMPVSSRRFFPKNIEGITTLNAKVVQENASIQLTWQFQKPNDPFLKEKSFRYVLYRGEGTGPMKRYQQLLSPEPIFEDKNVKNDIIYKYAVGVVYDDGKKTALSPEAFAKIKSQ